MKLIRLNGEFYLLNDESTTVDDIFFDNEAGTINILAVQQNGKFWLNDTDKIIASTDNREKLYRLSKSSITKLIDEANIKTTEFEVEVETKEVCKPGCINLVLNGERSMCCGNTILKPKINEYGYINILKIK
jgi:hypothetical protein